MTIAQGIFCGADRRAIILVFTASIVAMSVSGLSALADQVNADGRDETSATIECRQLNGCPDRNDKKPERERAASKKDAGGNTGKTPDPAEPKDPPAPGF